MQELKVLDHGDVPVTSSMKQDGNQKGPAPERVQPVTWWHSKVVLTG